MRIRGSVARRAVLGASLALIFAAAWCSATAYRASALGETRTLSMYNIHTKENLTVTFKRDGKYDEAALKQLNNFMRDWRANKEINMDPALIDLIWTLHQQLGSNEPVHLICGHRTAETNASMRKKGGGQAKRSQHILGKAADISFPDVSAKQLRNSALVQEHGGVGYYPTSGIPFVHVDTGNVRMWPRIPRLELAALFPDGNTKYLPIDGKPITRAGLQARTGQRLGEQDHGRFRGAVAESQARRRRRRGRGRRAERGRHAAAGARLLHAQRYRHRRRSSPAGLAASASATIHLCQRRRHVSLPMPDCSARGAQGRRPLPAYQDAEVVGAPEADDDHPEELSYVPFEIAGLMTDASVTYSRTVAPLTHPEQGNLDYLFDDMDRPTAFTLRPGSGYRRFGVGPAVLRPCGEKSLCGDAPHARSDAARPKHPLIGLGRSASASAMPSAWR